MGGTRRRQWPFPGDLPSERARQVCHEYRRALKAVDPETCAVIDSAAVGVGETWVMEEVAIEQADDLVTVARAAELVGRSVRWTYNLVEYDPDMIRAVKPIKVRLGDVQEAVARDRIRRRARRGY